MSALIGSRIGLSQSNGSERPSGGHGWSWPGEGKWGMMGGMRMGGLSWMWIPTLPTLALGILLVFAIFWKK